jgi:hypothetical protein
MLSGPSTVRAFDEMQQLKELESREEGSGCCRCGLVDVDDDACGAQQHSLCLPGAMGIGQGARTDVWRCFQPMVVFEIGVHGPKQGLLVHAKLGGQWQKHLRALEHVGIVALSARLGGRKEHALSKIHRIDGRFCLEDAPVEYQLDESSLEALVPGLDAHLAECVVQVFAGLSLVLLGQAQELFGQTQGLIEGALVGGHQHELLASAACVHQISGKHCARASDRSSWSRWCCL